MSKFEGTVEEIVFRNDVNGWTVISFNVEGSGRISAVGILPFLNAGEQVILDGELVDGINDINNGTEFVHYLFFRFLMILISRLSV